MPSVGIRIVQTNAAQFRSTSGPEALTIAQAGLMTSATAWQSLSVTTPAAIFPPPAPFGLAEGAPDLHWLRS
jgi:hypothetical protein